MSTVLTPRECCKLLFACAERKHRHRGKTFDLTLSDVHDAFGDGHCSRTGVPFDMRLDKSLPWRASLDRINNKVGYQPDNIQVVSRIYNVAKWTWTDEEVYTMARKLVDFHEGR